MNEDPDARQKEMDITEKWLGEIGGWQAMKAARSLVAAGRVTLKPDKGGLLQGEVSEGRQKWVAGLRIRSRTDLDNLCSCPQSRRTGQICEHSLAVALASISKSASALGASTATGPLHRRRNEGPAGQGVSPVPPTSAPSRHPIEETSVAGQLSLYLPTALVEHSEVRRGRSFSAFLRLEPTAERESSKLATWLQAKGVPIQTGPLFLPETECPGLIKALVDHPRVYLGKPTPGGHQLIAITSCSIRPPLEVNWVEGSESKGGEIVLGLIEPSPPRCIQMSPSETWLYHPISRVLHPWTLPVDAPEARRVALQCLQEKHFAETERFSLRWLVEHQACLEESFQITLASQVKNRYTIIPVAFQLHLQISGSAREIYIVPLVNFMEHQWRLMGISIPNFPIQDENKENTFYVRNIESEQALQRYFVTIGLHWNEDVKGFRIQGESEVLRFYSSVLPSLNHRYTVTLSEELNRVFSRWVRIEPILLQAKDSQHTTTSFNLNQEGYPQTDDWLNMSFDYRAQDGFRLTRAEVLRLLRTGQRRVQGSGRIQYGLDADMCESLEEALQDVPVTLTESGLRLDARHQDYLMPFAERAAHVSITDSLIDETVWRQQLGSLGKTLRSYQIQGVAWLAQRLRDGKGALLADDMGLGKTLQTIAVIQWLKDREWLDGSQGLALILCPKSLLSNWSSEFAKYAPALKVLTVDGDRRSETFDFLGDNDVIISSYSLIIRDLHQYKKRLFGLLVLDEASYLKNPDTQVTSAIRSLQSRSRLARTGTPVENGIQDLWSIFQILLPGYLGIRKTFQERFEKPIRSNPNSESGQRTAERLRRLVRPYLLRRTKTEVLTELPSKIEQVQWCDPSSQQAEWYRKVLEEGREEIRQARRRSGAHGARMTMLTVLLRLRQICCDPRLIMAKAPDMMNANRLDLTTDAGKAEAFDERLAEALAVDGGKVLVFSQFVAYLQLLRQRVESAGWGLAYLDGSTRDRAAEIARFQQDPSCRVFLISLKAGGYGLNLTQADHVFLMDPWWNPAVEAQAIDRAHRLGQSRSVHAFRFVTRGTVEERVLALQHKKRGIIEATVEERAPLMEGLTDQDLQDLLFE